MFTKAEGALWTLAKAGCYVCGKGDKLIATGILIEGEGQLALCDACLHDMALAAGWRLEDPHAREELEAEVERYRHEAATQAERAQMAEDRWEQYRTSVHDLLEHLAPTEPAVERPRNLRDPLTGKLVKR